jgi:hypothetical protein
VLEHGMDLSHVHVGLPTVPVFTGVTGAVNGMPTRPIEPSSDEFDGS